MPHEQKEASQNQVPTDSTTWRSAPMVLLKGLLMGSADVVPGVSGGTMALITGIYTRLIDAIRSIDTTAIRYLLRFRLADFFRHVHWLFLLSLGTGMVLAVLFFTRVISLPLLIFTHPEPIYGLFFGLIVGSVVLLLIDIVPIDFRKTAYLLLGTAIGWWVVTLVPTETPNDLWFIFFSGAVAICAMVLPGISGSFILLILGKYSYIFGQFSAIGGPDTVSALTILGVFGLGIVVGITSFSHFLSWLLHHYRVVTMSVLIGFLIGSLVVIWPWQTREYQTLEERVEVSSGDPRLARALPHGSNPLLPEYYLLTPAGQPAGDGITALIHVQKKLVHSKMAWPDASMPVAVPLAAMASGLVLVLGIGWLGKKAEKNGAA